MGRGLARPQAPRPFTLADAMILVAATALGLAMGRLERSPWSELMNWQTYLANRFKAIVPCELLTWACAMVAIRLRRPRPCLRRVFRQPGMVASCASALAGLVAFLALIPIHALFTRYETPSEIHIRLTTEPMKMAYAVGGAWLALALSGRCVCEKSRVDRIGRAIGVLWMLGALIENVMYLGSFL